MKPNGYIKETPLTKTYITPDGTLVDDTVALVDSTTALTGSQVTPSVDIKVEIKSDKPDGKIESRR